jgi:hypothetical protein
MPTRREVQERPIPHNLQGLFSTLQAQSGIMMRHSMGLRGLQVPQTASVPDIARYLVAYVAEGELPLSEARQIALDCREYSNKRAYLYTVPPADLTRWSAPPELSTRVVDEVDDIRIASNVAERVQYIRSDRHSLRILFTETHTYYEQDIGTLQLIPRSVLKFIVVDANKRTGALTLLMDGPSSRNPHGSALKYKTHYEMRMQELLQTVAEPMRLGDSLTRLEDQQLLQIQHVRVETEGGLIAITGRNVPDVREHPQYEGLRAARVQHDEADYLWFPRPHNNPGGLTIPVRPLKTRIHAIAGEVRFALHALRMETDYVLDKLRTPA